MDIDKPEFRKEYSGAVLFTLAIQPRHPSLVFCSWECIGGGAPSQDGKMLSYRVDSDPSGTTLSLTSRIYRSSDLYGPPASNTFPGILTDQICGRFSHRTKHGPLCERQGKQTRRIRLPHLHVPNHQR